jgi:hypothetical protein
MEGKEAVLKMTLELSEKRVSNFTEDELIEYIKQRLNYSLGFRGEVRNLRVLKARKKQS